MFVFWAQLALMLHTKVATVTSAAVDSRDSEDQLSHNLRKRQHKIDAQAAEITTVKAELNKASEEHKNLKNLFSPEKMVEAMTKAVSAIVKVKDMMYGWYMILCQFLDNSDSPSIVEQ